MKKLLLLSALALGFVACDKEDINDPMVVTPEMEVEAVVESTSAKGAPSSSRSTTASVSTAAELSEWTRTATGTGSEVVLFGQYRLTYGGIVRSQHIFSVSGKVGAIGVYSNDSGVTTIVPGRQINNLFLNENALQRAIDDLPNIEYNRAIYSWAVNQESAWVAGDTPTYDVAGTTISLIDVRQGATRFVFTAEGKAGSLYFFPSNGVPTVITRDASIHLVQLYRGTDVQAAINALPDPPGPVETLYNQARSSATGATYAAEGFNLTLDSTGVFPGTTTVYYSHTVEGKTGFIVVYQDPTVGGGYAASAVETLGGSSLNTNPSDLLAAINALPDVVPPTPLELLRTWADGRVVGDTYDLQVGTTSYTLTISQAGGNFHDFTVSGKQGALQIGSRGVVEASSLVDGVVVEHYEGTDLIAAITSLPNAVPPAPPVFDESLANLLADFKLDPVLRVFLTAEANIYYSTDESVKTGIVLPQHNNAQFEFNGTSFHAVNHSEIDGTFTLVVYQNEVHLTYERVGLVLEKEIDAHVDFYNQLLDVANLVRQYNWTETEVFTGEDDFGTYYNYAYSNEALKASFTLGDSGTEYCLVEPIEGFGCSEDASRSSREAFANRIKAHFAEAAGIHDPSLYQNTNN